ncbi:MULTISPECIES: Hsp20/alpha crystallin family protein [Streptomyces]|uniref:Hsp20/alpha crystallin family protein n=1 Tax=Streptomyces TaxID=1883 RepID=UPI001E4AC7EF|nr:MULTISPECIES: Hsp20/alpha crystallin family protein [Streptomyces]
MSDMTKRLPGRSALSDLPDLPDPSDWAEAGFPVLDDIPARHGIHVEERLADGRYVLQAELPGIDAEDIEITVAEGFLTLRAERSDETARQGRAEFKYGHSTPLPALAKSDEATAQYQHGVLTITMPVPEAKTGMRTMPVREPASASAH